LSRDLTTNQNVLQKVVRTFTKQASKLVRLITNKDTIFATPEHPFYAVDDAPDGSNQGNWMSAGSLKKGIKVLLASGMLASVESAFAFDTTVTVYNFEVEKTHNYFVGTEGVLVHNLCLKDLISLFYKGNTLLKGTITKKLLLVGEGNFSFSKSIVSQSTASEKALVTATEYFPLNQLDGYKNVSEGIDPLQNVNILQQNGVRVLGGIDATKLSSHFPDEKFSTLMFNFPFVDGAGKVNRTKDLLKSFINQADRITESGGYVYITHTTSWFDKLGIGDLHLGTNFEIFEIKNFDKSVFPGYLHSMTNSGSSTASTNSAVTIIFKKK
jgi:Domain of unknown function (DUF2431)/Pretoxin HINT domain